MNLHPALAWLGQQLHGIGGFIVAVASGGVTPARQAVLYTLVLIVLLVFAPRIAKLIGKVTK